MDQDSFRQLLSKPSATSPSNRQNQSRDSWYAPSAQGSKTKVISSSEPAFKPRKVKKKDEKYRDRASERRLGDDGEYEQVESVLEDMEARATGLNLPAPVKGLDFSLLEKAKARELESTGGVDDDTLEAAFISAKSDAPKKRTREDIIRDLKEKREKGGTEGAEGEEGGEKKAKGIEEAKKEGKFKPIGFKPIGGGEGKKKKLKTKDGEGGERKKKKRKVMKEDEKAVNGTKDVEADAKAPAILEKSPLEPARQPTPEPPPDDEFDIFAGAGEYEGVDLGDSDEEEGEIGGDVSKDIIEEQQPAMPAKWFDDDEEEGEEPEPKKGAKRPRLQATSKSGSPPPRSSHLRRLDKEDADSDEDTPPARLVPLSSSAMPSIKEILAMDDEMGKRKTKRKRKEKKGGDDDDDDGGGGKGKEKKMTAEERAERDFKQLKSYTEKKARAGK